MMILAHFAITQDCVGLRALKSISEAILPGLGDICLVGHITAAHCKLSRTLFTSHAGVQGILLAFTGGPILRPLMCCFITLSCVPLIDWISDTLSQGYTNLQSSSHVLAETEQSSLSDSWC